MKLFSVFFEKKYLLRLKISLEAGYGVISAAWRGLRDSESGGSARQSTA